MSTEIKEKKDSQENIPKNSPLGNSGGSMVKIVGMLLAVYGAAYLILLIVFTQTADAGAFFRSFGMGLEPAHLNFGFFLAAYTIVVGIAGVLLCSKAEKAPLLMYMVFCLMVLHLVNFFWNVGTSATADFPYVIGFISLAVHAFLFMAVSYILPVALLFGVNKIKEGCVSRVVRHIWTEYSIIVVAVVLFLIAGLLTPRFVASANLLIILRQASVIGVIAMGMTFVIITGGIDLSSGHVVAVSGAVLIYLQGNPEIPLIVAILACFAVGTVIGAINGFVVTSLRVPAFIATLAIGIAVRSIALNLVRGMALTGRRVPEFTQIFTGNVGFVPNPLVIWIVLAVILGCVLKYTKIGSYIFAVGGNENAAKYSGISPIRTKLFAYTLTGFCAALAATIDFSRNAAIAVTSAGNMYEFDAITAVVVGGTALAGGRGKILNTFIGVIIIMTVTNLMIMFGINPYLSGAIRGLIIMSAVLLQRREKT